MEIVATLHTFDNTVRYAPFRLILLPTDSHHPGHDCSDLRNGDGCVRVPAAGTGRGNGRGNG